MQKVPKRKQRSSILNQIANYILFFLACALIGWLWEVILTFIQHGYFSNRGVLHGPWLPIYGFGGLIIAIFLQHFDKHPWLVFLTAAICCGIMEYFTGWYLETFHNLKWWDYSDLPLNLNGRVCAISLLCFGLCGLIVTYLLEPTLIHHFNTIPYHPKLLIAFCLVIVFLIDAGYSNIHPNTGEGITTEIINSNFYH